MPKKITYVEPTNYFPKDILKKAEAEAKKKKAEKKKPTAKKK